MTTDQADRHSLRLKVGWVLALAITPSVAPAAASCSFTYVAPVSFGVYNVFDASPNLSGIGGLGVSCKGGGGPFVISLGTGQSHSYVSRVMQSGNQSLHYNLFTNPSRTVVWGNGSGGSGTVTVTKNSTVTLSVYGLIPAGQDVGVGTYADCLIATINF